jgi:nitroreductase
MLKTDKMKFSLPKYSEEEMLARAKEFYELVKGRRTVRDFSSKSVPREVIEECLRAAGTAPSGANKQPWHFVAVSDPEIKKEIREGAEEEERKFYSVRAPEDWLDALAEFGTDAIKPYLETAPYVIVVFAQKYGIDEQGEKVQHYYVQESVGIATGLLITALHNCGLATLTHTPSPMGFLNRILKRPDNERPFVLLAIGYPAKGATVPDLKKKELGEFASWVD